MNSISMNIDIQERKKKKGLFVFFNRHGSRKIGLLTTSVPCFGLFRLSNKEADLAGRPVSFLSITRPLYSTFVSYSYSNWLLHGFVLFVK
ncbi:hypothetical protein Peur_034023 [Populus x canadensis]